MTATNESLGDGRTVRGQVALITGGTQGLGAGIARRFAEEGASVAITGRSVERGEAVCDELRSMGVEAFFVSADLSNPEACFHAVDAVLERFGRINCLVNSAADTKRSTLETVEVDFFDYQMALNVRAPMLLAQRALPSLKEHRGTIINIGSINAYMGGNDLLSYSTTKGALMTMSLNMASALKNHRVRVHCLNVGWMDTEGEREIHRDLGSPDDFIDKAAKGRPIGRLLLPQDIAAACAFLASDQAHAFSGAVIDLEQHPPHAW